jgi:hypothetical protein
MSTDSSRQEFEKWFDKASYGYPMAYDQISATYRNTVVQLSWTAWQASNAQSQELIAELLVLAKGYLDWVELDSRLRLTKLPEGIEATIRKAKSHLKQQEQE